MTGGLIALAAALVAATALGLGLRWRAGRFRVARSGSPTRPVRAAGTGQPDGTGPRAGTGTDVLTEADLGGRLGRQATLVQF